MQREIQSTVRRLSLIIIYQQINLFYTMGPINVLGTAKIYRGTKCCFHVQVGEVPDNIQLINNTLVDRSSSRRKNSILYYMHVSSVFHAIIMIANPIEMLRNNWCLLRMKRRNISRLQTIATLDAYIILTG